jgi:hypothetical protein
MSDASALPALSTTGAPARWTIPRPATALLAAFAAVGAALLASAPDAASTLATDDAELVMLLRFMAGVKAMLALTALAASVWRLGYPASPLLGAAYIVAPALMCAAPVVIWQVAHVALGAGLFHGGLALLLLALYADRGRTSQLAQATLLRLRRA